MNRIALALALAAAPLAAAGPVNAAPAAEEKATKDDYTLDLSGTDTTVKAGATGKFDLVIRPKNGKKIHPEAPLDVVFENAKGVTPQKPKLSRGDIVDKKSAAPEVRTTFRAGKAGAASIDAKVSFFICTDAWCQRMTDRVTVPITVE